MASLFKASQLRSAWSPEECGVFAAHKEFELLKLLSTADKKVISMARKMGHAAVNAQVNKHGNAGAPGQPSHTRHQDSRESECGRAASVSRTKRSKQERRQRQEAASRLQAMARSFIVRKVKLPAARAAARNIDRRPQLWGVAGSARICHWMGGRGKATAPQALARFSKPLRPRIWSNVLRWLEKPLGLFWYDILA